MSKKFLLAVLVAVLAISVFVPIGANATFASADTQNEAVFRPHGMDGYTLTTLTDNKKPAAVRFSGCQFGSSGIGVTILLYTDPKNGFTLDFWIGAKDADLTASQRQTRDQLVELFDWVANCISKIDLLANTTYDGSTLANGTVLPISDVVRYNNAAQGDTIQIDGDTYKMLEISREMYQVTNGAFNPAVYRLVDLWGFSSRIYTYMRFGLQPYDRNIVDGGYPLPAQKYLDAFKDPAYTNFGNDAVTLSTQTEGDETNYYVTKNVASAMVDGVAFPQWIDLGGVAKGYVVDLIKQRIYATGHTRYEVDAGSSSLSYGWGHGGEQTQLNLIDPFPADVAYDPQGLIGFKVGQTAVSTSGQYIRRYFVDGVEYSHIIDGRAFNGAPAQMGIKSVTVVVPDDNGANYWATKADCLSTALTVLGKNGVIDMSNGYFADNGIQVLVVHQDKDTNTKRILANFGQDKITFKAASLAQYGWAMVADDTGKWVFDNNAAPITLDQKDYKWLIITLGVVGGLAVVALVVYQFVRGKNKGTTNVQNAKKDKPFKKADVVVYLLVGVLIVALFGGIFGFGNKDTTYAKTVVVSDLQTNEVLFSYDVQTGDYTITTNTHNNWNIVANRNEDGSLKVRFQRDFDGEMRFDEMTIVVGKELNVKMTDSLCGFHQECVKYMLPITKAGQSITCLPNQLVITSN